MPALAVPNVAVVAFVLLVAVASGAGATFGSDGIAEPGPPASGASGIGAFDLAPAPGGRIVAAIGGLTERDWFGAARLSAGGTLDRSFGAGGYTTPLKLRGRGSQLHLHANSVVPVSGGRMLVGGFQDNAEGGTAPLVARYRADGKLDRSFGHGGLIAPKPASEGVDVEHVGVGGGILLDIAAASGGRVIGAGAQNDIAGARPAAMVIAYDANGRVDPGFGDHGRFLMPERRKNGYTAFGAVEASPGGKLLVAGYLRGRLTVLRLTAAGALDPSFGGGDGMTTVAPGGTEPNCCVATARLLVSGGRILVIGRVQRGTGRPLLLARLEANGELDRGFGHGGRVVGLPDRPETKYFTPRALAVQGRRILVAGPHETVPFEEGAPVEVMTVVGFRPNGAIDTGFGSQGVETVEPSREGRAISATELPGARALFGGAIIGPPPGESQSGGGFEPLLKVYGGR